LGSFGRSCKRKLKKVWGRVGSLPLFSYIKVMEIKVIKETQLMQAHPGSVETVIDILKHMDIDGETMEHILREVGIEDQMLKQLLLKANYETLVQLILERNEI
jgi:hypothetical protein